ncbi:MAG: hypothetical protein HRT99_03830, partial [Mycoplasmatales bacterium]|nr:hypothetical protein [Mycoplasmatales bacterium]
VKNLTNFYFISFLTYKLTNINDYSIENDKWYKQWYELKNSYTHIFAVASSIISKLVPKSKKVLIPVNNNILSLDNTSLKIVGVISDDPRDKVYFDNGGNNIDLFKNKNTVSIRTGILAKGMARVNLVLFSDKETNELKNFLLETRMINFDKNDSDEMYDWKIEQVERVHEEIVTFLHSYKLSKIHVIDILIKMIDIFDEKYLEKLNSLILETQLKLNNRTSYLKLEEASKKQNLYLDDSSETNGNSLPSFKFEETTIIDRKMLIEVMNEMEGS